MYFTYNNNMDVNKLHNVMKILLKHLQFNLKIKINDLNNVGRFNLLACKQNSP